MGKNPIHKMIWVLLSSKTALPKQIAVKTREVGSLSSSGFSPFPEFFGRRGSLEWWIGKVQQNNYLRHPVNDSTENIGQKFSAEFIIIITPRSNVHPVLNIVQALLTSFFITIFSLTAWLQHLLNTFQCFRDLFKGRSLFGFSRFEQIWLHT